MSIGGSPLRADNDAETAPPSFGPERFFNRELSWLAFNRRVMEEARNPAHPLLERLRFLSISGSNLDEFFMVRVAGLKGQQLQGIEDPSADGRSPGQQLAEIEAEVNRLVDQQQSEWQRLHDLLAQQHIIVHGAGSDADALRALLRQYFIDQI
ncbi:MAG TPA: RNA degradosome polyphosphate kinase, partial [Sphingopyxis sp.]|nr:RNA degradosome polyphosphate kinase [Sphingopyxis sp.]